MSIEKQTVSSAAPIRLLNLGAIPAGYTQAIYHVLAEQMHSGAQDTIILCRPIEPYLCLGYHQIFESIFDAAECNRRSLPVFRRQLGGGATYLDSRQIFYQCVFHQRHMPVMIKDIYAFALAAPVMALRRLGLAAELRDTNEIEVRGKRIAGTGGGKIGEATVVVGNLLFDFDYETMAAVWRAPSPSFRKLAAKALRESLVNLNALSVDLSMEDAAALLIDCYAATTGRPLEPGDLTHAELQAVDKKIEELGSPDFLAMHSDPSPSEPVRALKISGKASIRYDEVQCNDYALRASFWVMENCLQEAILDSTPAREWHTIEQGLRGCPYQEWKDRCETMVSGLKDA